MERHILDTDKEALEKLLSDEEVIEPSVPVEEEEKKETEVTKEGEEKIPETPVAKFDPAQLEELKESLKPKQEEKKEPERQLTEEEIKKQIGWYAPTESDVTKLFDLDTEPEERVKILTEMLQSSANMGYQSASYKLAPEVESLKKLANQFQQKDQQTQVKKVGQALQSKLINKYPFVKKYEDIALGEINKLNPQFQGKLNTPQDVDTYIEAIGQATKAKMDQYGIVYQEGEKETPAKKISSSKETPPNLSGGQTGVVDRKNAVAQKATDELTEIFNRRFNR